MKEDWELLGWPSKEAYEEGMRKRRLKKDPRITGVVGVCATCGFGHDREQFAQLGFGSAEEYEASSLANRVVIDGKNYCPDCARAKWVG